jgi:hypothetical protein
VRSVLDSLDILDTFEITLLKVKLGVFRVVGEDALALWSTSTLTLAFASASFTLAAALALTLWSLLVGGQDILDGVNIFSRVDVALL